MSVARPVISGWSAVSAYGIGRAPLAEGLRSGTAADVQVGSPWPGGRAFLVPDFDPVAVLGRKGTRSMHRTTAFTISAIGEVLDGLDRERLDGGRNRVGVVVGISNGAVQGMMDFTRSSLTGLRPFFVDPAEMPKLVMNAAAGQSAIWHRLHGPNTTVAGGSVAGLLGLRYSQRLLANGRADAVFCGGVEECTPARAWLNRHVAGSPAQRLGEGCAVLLVESGEQPRQDRPVLAEVVRVRLRSFACDGLSAALRSCVDGVPGDDVWLAAPSATSGVLAGEECAELTALFGADAVARAGDPALLGDTAAASATFRIATALCRAEEEPAAHDRTAVITSVDPREQVVAAAVLRIPGRG